MESGLQQLAEAASIFNAQHRRLTNALNVGHALSRGATAEVVAVGLDVRDSCALLVDLYGGALAEFIAEHQARTANAPPPPPKAAAHWTEAEWRAWLAERPMPEPDWDLYRRLIEVQESGRSWSSRLSLGHKATFFFIRAYQDALCRVLLVLGGQRAGGYSSMSSAMKKPSNPVRVLLDRELPEYGPWFRQWTMLRDKLKRGTSFSFQLIGGELAVVFSGIPLLEGEGVGLTTDLTVFLADVATAVRHSAAAAGVTVSRATAGFDADALAYVERLD